MPVKKITKLLLPGQTRKLYKYQDFQPLSIQEYFLALSVNTDIWLKQKTNREDIDMVSSLAKSENIFYNEDTVVIDGPIFLFDMTGFAYFHALYDKVIQYEFIKYYIPNIKLIPITYSNRPLDPGNIVYRDFLELYGISVDDVINLNNKENYVFREAYNFIFEHNELMFPLKEDMAQYDLFEAWSDPEGYENYVKIGSKELLKKVSPYLTNLHNKKIFVSRVKINNEWRLPHNSNRNFVYSNRFISLKDELELESFFIKMGYEVVFSEDLSFIDQVSMYSSASHIAGLKSSGFCNMLFCKPGTQIISINLDSSFECWYGHFAKYFGLNYQEVPKLLGEVGGFQYQHTLFPERSWDYSISHITEILKARYQDIL